MSERTTNSKKEGVGYSARIAIVIGLISSLTMGFLDLAINIASRPSGLMSFLFMLAPLATTISLFFLIYVVLWFVIVSHIGRLLKIQATPLAISLALFLTTIFIIPSLFPLFPTDLSSLIVLLAISFLISIISISILISTGGYFTAKVFARAPKEKRRNSILAFILAIPLVLGETAAFLWLRTYRVELFATRSLLLNTGYIVVVILTLVLFYRIGKAAIVRILIAFVMLVVLSPLAIQMAASKGSSKDYKSEDHRIKHVLLLSVDTLRRDVLSCYGSKDVSTPHIDQLAEDGVLFERAISAAPWTLPSFSSIMTGLSPTVHRTTGRVARLPDNLRTLAEYMNEAGYYTAGIGDNMFLGPKYNVSQGFLEYNFFPKSSIGGSFGVRLLQRALPKQFPSEASTSDLTRLAIDWMESNREKDFFLWLHYYDPHIPYSPPRDFLPKREPLPNIGVSFSSMSKVRAGYFVPSLSERKWIKDLYDGEVRYVDENIGKLLDALNRLRLYDESLIVFASDHGEEFWEHDSFGHGHTLYDDLLWVPLIIKLPLSASKGRISRTVATPSIMPTVLDLCGINYESNDLSFSTLSPLWGSDADAFEERPIVSTGLLYYDNRESIVFDGMKYIHSLLTGREELYDLARDPGEQTSIAPSSPKKVERARKMLADHSQIAKVLSERYGITEEEIELDKETIQRLKALGYIQ